MCAFSVVTFWQFSEKIEKFVPRFMFSLSDPVFALRQRLKYPRIPCAQKNWFGLLWGERSAGWV